MNQITQIWQIIIAMSRKCQNTASDRLLQAIVVFIEDARLFALFVLDQLNPVAHSTTNCNTSVNVGTTNLGVASVQF
jgi:hypothetical protein